MALDTRPGTPSNSAAPDATRLVRDVRRSLRRRYVLVLAAVVVVWLGVFAARVLLGDVTVTIPDFVRIVLGADIPVASFEVMESKLPRAVAGTLAGLAFGAAGAVFQSMLRNPLASPDVVGVTMGSSAAAVVGMTAFGLDGIPLAVAAVVGGLVVAVAVLFLSGSKGVATYRMILVGIGLAATLQAVIQWVFTTTDVYKAQDAMVWLTGSLNSVTWGEILRMTVTVALLLPVVAALAPRLQLLELGDDAAAGLGLRAAPTRAWLMGTTVVLTAVTTSVVGPIAFVSLLAGPITRRINGGRPSIPIAALIGAAIVVAADYIGAYLVGTTNMPVGVVTGIAGAPFLLWLLLASSRTLKDG
ncbi:FecCD family ABC transporter permease [Luteipulveratus flavus]|uniref:Iron chelate uptake ABC transporter family permease subunit n=1 Tax=Luteipulveratus flavus TaxID=3031728 RepID=A0ABT6CAI6_9MICO|nr:iron chelate uptake ABC transporter family permease subunit [Luteipulveratus sp. YIM 133296]MDF8265912.1 iron chelate uptake ABC transporter family permease subunit [Luteipulveratus sp. YIM 133296]